MDKYSFLNTIHPEEIEKMYEKYLNSPDSLETQWRVFFQGFDFANENYVEKKTTYNDGDVRENQKNENTSKVVKELKIMSLIQEYRERGHLFTKTNPVRERRYYSPSLNDLSRFGLSEADLEETFESGKTVGLNRPAKLKEIIEILNEIYCDSIGVEFTYIRKPEEKEWIKEWINNNKNKPSFSNEKKKEILNHLNHAVEFERFLHKKYVGKKRFSLEGCEALIPALKEVVISSAKKDIKEIVFGMPHRGRLNVLTNVFGKSYKDIFTEFEEKDYKEKFFEGDVKYHLGWTTENEVGDKKIRLNIAPNPSHLETVNSIVEGLSRCKIDNYYEIGNYSQILPVLMHGDAAIAGQGIVYEMAQMSQLNGYKTGGTLHIILNNQIGFTTNYTDSRSSTYCTDIAKLTLSPVLHINADDVDAVIHAVQFAVDYRTKFKKDVYIDLLGYRKYGHNEGDEPRFTQPILYKLISKHPNVREIYSKKLLGEGVITAEYLNKLDKDFKENLEKELNEGKSANVTKIEPIMKEEWKNFISTNKDSEVLKNLETKISKKDLLKFTEIITTVPKDKKIVKKVARILDDREKMVNENRVDWGMAENLAYASLLNENYNIRISGQDVERGTFSHRHSVVKAEDSEEKITLLKNINPNGIFNIHNSSLSEYGVMGYEYGYAMGDPNTLTIWEAQFGDFSNGSQIIIDQYLSSAEDKWKMQNGLVVLLPHGYEGQGAEHSSARMERYLQLCANNNMFMANCSTPANFFHLLRAQMKKSFRKPLVVFTPKSLLRHPKCISSVEDFTNDKFHLVIDDILIKNKDDIKKIILCTGKFYYDLLAEREKLNREDIAFIRIEQIYPLDKENIYRIINSYKNANEIIWGQEEPENMGAWVHIMRHLDKVKLRVCSLKESGTTATGNSKRWAKRHQEVIDNIFKDNKNVERENRTFNKKRKYRKTK